VTRGAHFCAAEEAARLGEIAFDAEAGAMASGRRGASASELARSAGFEVPEGTRLLVAEPGGVGPEHPLSHEILTTILAWYPVADHEEAVATCAALADLGGTGHTAGIHATDDAAVADFARRVDVGRVVVSSPCTRRRWAASSTR
jgi:acetaldehyde dehydrogenase/alcohol dehydrogenase